MITVVPRWLLQKNYIIFINVEIFKKLFFFKRRLLKKIKNILKYFGFLRKWNLQKLINHLANMCQSCPGTTVTIFVFWGQRSKGFSTKNKEGEKCINGL